jgi:NitT/TauT family transport system permease protein
VATSGELPQGLPAELVSPSFARTGVTRLQRGTSYVLLRLSVPVVAVALWELGARTEVLDKNWIPAPSVVATSWYDWLFGTPGAAASEYYSGTWMTHAWASSQRVLLGFAVAAVLGIVIGVLIGWFRLVAVLFDPLIQVLRPIPITAWLPFAIVFFGIKQTSAIFLIALGAFFPIVVNAAAGAAQTPTLLVRAALMLGLPKWKLLFRVVIPSALPSIMTGLRLGVGVAWVLVIVAEMLAVKSGLGFVLWDAFQFIRMDIIVAAMLSVGIIGFLSDLVIVLIGKWVLRWSKGLYG